MEDLHRVVEQIAAAGAAFRCLQQGGVDTSRSSGKLMLAILGGIAEFENDIRREWQRDGIEKASRRGLGGRPTTIDAASIAALRREELGPTAVTHRLLVSRASVYRLGSAG